MSPRLHRHLEPYPVCPQNAERPGPHSISCQGINTAVPVQGYVGLAQLEEYGIDDRLSCGNELLKQICLEGDGPCSSPHVKFMQSVMELDGRRYPAIDDYGYHLPQDFHQANTYEVSASPLGDHHHRLLGTQRRNLSSPEGRLYDGEKLLLVPQDGVLLLCHRAKPHPEVLRPHSGRSSGVMYP